MHPHDLLDHLDAAGARLTTRRGRLALTGPAEVRADETVLAAIAEHRDLLLAHVQGSATGHALGRCTSCGELSLTHYRPASKYPPCRMTPGCSGRHQPRQTDVGALTSGRAPGRPTIGQGTPNQPKSRLLGPMPPWPAWGSS